MISTVKEAIALQSRLSSKKDHFSFCLSWFPYLWSFSDSHFEWSKSKQIKPIRPYHDTFSSEPKIFNLNDSIWCTIVTMTTVGYGDVIPQVRLSRAVVVCACFFGSFLVSLIVVTITNFAMLSPQELNAYHMIEKRTMEQSTQKLAG